MNWKTYLVLCSDGTLYAGISVDVPLRVDKHNAGKGSKYVRNRRPCQLVYTSEASYTRSAAQIEEFKLKALPRWRKRALAILWWKRNRTATCPI